MRYVVTLFAICSIFTVSGQTLDWAFKIGGSDYEFNYKACTDAFGNIYVAGEFYGTVDFDPGIGVVNLTADLMGDAYIAKYDSSMNFQWVRQIRSSGNDWASALVNDAAGNLFVTGMFEDSMNIVGTSTYLYNNYPGWNVFLLKFSSSGVLSWAVQYGSRGTDESYHTTIDNKGNIYVCGMLQDSVKFNNGANAYVMEGYQGYVAKFNSNGIFTKLIHMGSALNVADTRSVKVDQNGNVYCTGVFGYKAFFDSGLKQDSLMSNGFPSDIYLAKYDSNGVYNWAFSIGGTSNDYGEGVYIESSAIYITGNFAGTADFNPGAATNSLTATGLWDGYIAKYDLNGNFIWAKKIGGSGDDWAHDITGNNNGLLYVTGYFSGIADFDPSNQTFNLTSAGLEDAFLGAYSTSGDLFWATRFGGIGSDYVTSGILDVSGALVLSGGFENTVDFDPGIGIYNISSSGNLDTYVSRFHLPFCNQPILSGITANMDSVCEGDSVYISIGASDNLKDASSWKLYVDSCSGLPVMTNTTGIFGLQPSGSKTYFVRATGGCALPSVCASATVKVKKVDATISISAGQLHANSTTAKYQWYDCVSKSILPNDTGQYFTPPSAGNYALIASESGCVDTSDCIAVFGIGMATIVESGYRIFPNPASGLVNIELRKFEGVSIFFIDQLGRISNEEMKLHSESVSIDVSRFTPGVYQVIFKRDEVIINRSLLLVN